ncbi:MAG TPA: xanthine dehydrogenase small subunit [Alphaproteobacteria bacterium]|nr:xanthine dehydrogenase small subunit [Alphaproteobacteria bacterium]
MSDAIRFLLNGEPREVRGLSPTTTVLEYLRGWENKCGTKEGCAEGDCGACTVALAEAAEDGGLAWRSVNACIQFLPTLDGKALYTVESLRAPDGALHPVQRAMVECHGSQCGFCTPGFVMSLFALTRNAPAADDETIHDALTGNLCRCTGYRPILDAARSLGAEAGDDHIRAAEAEVAATLRRLQRDDTFVYEHDGAHFFAPRKPKALAKLLDSLPNATLLAGGTDVGLWVTKQHRRLPTLVYTGNIAKLHRIRRTEAGLEIGAAATHTEAFEALAGIEPSMRALWQRFASLQVRNAGTLGGNIANGSPIGDGMPPLIALGARIVLTAAEGSRELPLDEFYIAYRQTALRPGEFVERVIVPPLGPDTLFKTYKVSKRFDQDISAVCGGFAVRLEDGRVAEARLAFGGMAAIPKRAAAAEQALTGQVWGEAAVAAAMAALEADFQPLSDMRASAGYRGRVAANLLRRFWLEASGAVDLTQVYRHAG